MNEEPLDLELNGDDGDWVIETQPDRILFLSFPDTESSEALKNLLTVSYSTHLKLKKKIQGIIT